MTDVIPEGTAARAPSDQEVTVGKLNELLAASQAAVVVSNRLALAMVEYQERARTARRRFRATMAAVAAVALVLLAGIYILLDSARTSRNQLADCIRPTGSCYQQEQARTAGILGDVQKIIVLAASCAPSYVELPLPARAAAIEKCIEVGLK